jgi:hypothetical protein
MFGHLVTVLPILAGSQIWQPRRISTPTRPTPNSSTRSTIGSGPRKALLAEDAVFHRANAAEVQSGPDAIVAHFEQPIGGEWKVKFARLDSEEQLVGNDGRVVQRGDFAITAGADDGACSAGSYMMTWAPAGDAWRLQVLTWQDLETDLENCK